MAAFKDLKAWCPNWQRANVQINHKGKGRPEKRACATYDKLCAQFTKAKVDFDSVERCAVTGEWDPDVAQKAWNSVECIFDGMCYWCTAQNIKEFCKPYSKKKQKEIIHALETSWENDGKKWLNAIISSNRTNYPSIFGISTLHYIERTGLHELVHDHVLDEDLEKLAEIRDGIPYLRTAMYQERKGLSGGYAQDRNYKNICFVPKITAKNAEETIYRPLCRIMDALGKINQVSAFKKYIPKPMTEKELETARRTYQEEINEKSETNVRERLASMDALSAQDTIASIVADMPAGLAIEALQRAIYEKQQELESLFKH